MRPHARISAVTGGSDRAYCAEGGCGVEQASFGGRPIDAWIGYRDAVFQLRAIRAERLISCFDIALEHRAHDRIAAAADLIDQRLQHRRLPSEIPAGLRMRAIDHHSRLQTRIREHLAAFADTACVVVRFASAAKNDVRIGISRGSDYGRETILSDPQKGMGTAR